MGIRLSANRQPDFICGGHTEGWPVNTPTAARFRHVLAVITAKYDNQRTGWEAEGDLELNLPLRQIQGADLVSSVRTDDGRWNVPSIRYFRPFGTCPQNRLPTPHFANRLSMEKK
jgi:hypothetical protein